MRQRKQKTCTQAIHCSASVRYLLFFLIKIVNGFVQRLTLDLPIENSTVEGSEWANLLFHHTDFRE